MDNKVTATILGVLAGLMLPGCRHAPPGDTGGSSFVMVEPPADRTRPPKESAETAEPSSRAQFREASVQEKSIVLPVYPARALAAKAGAAKIGVKVVVDTEGRVVAIRPSMLAISITPPGYADDFREAVEEAVRLWRFHPARIEHIETVTEQGFTYRRLTRTEMIEAEFDLAFSFTTAGKVEAGGAED